MAESQQGITGSWHSLHLIEVIPDDTQKKAEYRLTTSIQLYLTVRTPSIGEAKQNGTLTRQVLVTAPLQNSPRR